VRTLKEGDHFGEIALIYNCLRTATVQSDAYSVVAEISREHFIAMLNRFSELRPKFKEGTAIYKDPWKRYITSLLRKIKYINDFMEKSVLKEIVYYLDVQKYDANNWIYRPGDTVDKIQFIGDGEVEVSFCINDI
jgi:CRP-like cAMP-binding protein